MHVLRSAPAKVRQPPTPCSSQGPAAADAARAGNHPSACISGPQPQELESVAASCRCAILLASTPLPSPWRHHACPCMHTDLCVGAHAGSWCSCITHLSLSARHLDLQLLQPLLQPHLTHLILRGGDLDRKDGCDARQLVDMLLQRCPRLESLDLQVGGTVCCGRHGLTTAGGGQVCWDSAPRHCADTLALFLAYQHTSHSQKASAARGQRRLWLESTYSEGSQQAFLTAMSAALCVCVGRTVICLI